MAAVLAAAYRSRRIEPEDALRIIRHELRRRQTNKKLTILRRSTGAHDVVQSYAAKGVPLPKNGSDDALHADHVHPVTVEHLKRTFTPEDWLAALDGLGEVVCVTAAENRQLEVEEHAGVTGPAKYNAIDMTFVDQHGQPWPTPTGGPAQTAGDLRIAAMLATSWAPGTAGKGLLLIRDGEPRLCTWQTEIGGSPHHMVAVERLDIADDALRAYLAFGADGACTIWAVSPADEPEVALQVLELDGRLHLARPDSGWCFDGA